MKSDRLNIYLDHEQAIALEQFAVLHHLKKSAVVAAALRNYLSPDSDDMREAALSRRFDQLSRQLEKSEQDLMILTETLAIFIRYYLSVASPIPEAHQQAARAHGKARFSQFVEQLAGHLQRGNSLVRDLHEALYPDSPYTQAAAPDPRAGSSAGINP